MQDEILWKHSHIEMSGNITTKSHVMYEGIEGRITNSGIVSCHSLQNLSPSVCNLTSWTLKTEKQFWTLKIEKRVWNLFLTLKKNSFVEYTSPVSRRCTEGDKHMDFKFSIYSNLWAGIAQSACKLGHGPDNQGIMSQFSAGSSVMLFFSSPECPVWLWNPPHSMGTKGCYHGRDVSEATHLYLIPRLGKNALYTPHAP